MSAEFNSCALVGIWALMTELNFCPKCETELIENSRFCHSCGQNLSDFGDAAKVDSTSTQGDGGSSSADIFRDDFNMDSVDIDPYNLSDGEDKEMMEEQIRKVVDEHELTIDDLDPEEVFWTMIVGEILKRSAEIKIDEAQKDARAHHLSNHLN
jgi:hypothetical protein